MDNGSAEGYGSGDPAQPGWQWDPVQQSWQWNPGAAASTAPGQPAGSGHWQSEASYGTQPYASAQAAGSQAYASWPGGYGTAYPGAAQHAYASGAAAPNPASAAGSSWAGAGAPAAAPAAARPADADTPHGTPFGRYLLVAELGRGGMGVVYKAYQPELKRYCAIKVLHGHEAARLVHEGQACARLGKHPNIVQVYDAGFVGETAYIAMEMVAGTPLDDVLRTEGPLEEARVLEIGYKVAVALHHAHVHDLVHRDMKPANIIVDAQGEPHVLDFGLAKDITAGDTQFAGLVVGTPAYMPPEQFNPESGGVDARADIYALGATLYHLLAGRPPFEGSLREIMLQALTSRPEPLRARCQVSRDLEAVIAKAMEREPRDRYQSALEMADDLSRVTAGEPPRARRLTPLGRAVRRIVRHPVLVTLACLLALFVAASVVYLSQRVREMEALWAGLAQQITHLSANEVRKLLDPALPLVRELHRAAELGLLPLADRRAMTLELAARFEVRDFDWLNWTAADGSYIGITRRDGKTIAVHTWLEGETGWELEYEILPDGSLREVSRIEHVYDARTEDDYPAAVAAAGPVWVGPYRWEEEASLGADPEWGAGCALAFRRQGEVIGVFTADYLLTQLSDFLAEQTRWPQARSFLLKRDGQAFARSDGSRASTDPVLEAALAALPDGGLGALRPGHPVAVTYRSPSDGEEYTAALEVFTLAGGLEWASAVITPVRSLRGDVDRMQRWFVLIAIGGLLVLFGGVTWSIVRRWLRVRRTVALTGAARLRSDLVRPGGASGAGSGAQRPPA
ncbi:MAG: hypothetical protein KatS3mg102_2841 [Planctomycetota bacterium]|nr:MAG: hypothetical protein KatS3mg102_2841 [Planctomycetota bacterium]